MMSKMNVPELRFPEFSEEWEEKKLEEIIDFSKGKGISKADLSDEGAPCVLYGELYTKYNEEINEVHSKTYLPEDRLKHAFFNDVLVPSSGETSIDIATASSVGVNNVLAGGDINILTPEDDVKGHFVSLMINGKYKFELAKFAQGKTVVHLYNNDIKKLEMKYPSIEEQNKISILFSKFNRLIELEEKKLELLEEQMKGYMQKIFSQELRFKDENGDDYPDWEEKKLLDLAEVKTGNMNVQDSEENGIYEFFDRSQLIKYLNIFTFDEEAIIYPGEGSEFLPKYFKGKYSLHQRAYSIFNIQCNPVFLYYILQTKGNHFLKFAVGSTVKSLRMSSFDKLSLMMPTIEEQGKIERFLSKLERRVEVSQEKRNELLNVKKGLLGKLFI